MIGSRGTAQAVTGSPMNFNGLGTQDLDALLKWFQQQQQNGGGSAPNSQMQRMMQGFDQASMQQNALLPNYGNSPNGVPTEYGLKTMGFPQGNAPSATLDRQQLLDQLQKLFMSK